MKEKKKRIKIKISGIIIIIVLILLAKFLLIEPLKIKFKGYSLMSSYRLYFSSVKSEVLNNEYSQVLDEIIGTKYFDKQYIKEYFEIDYYDRVTFNEYITNFLNNGYDTTTINKINKLDNKDIYKIANTKESENLPKYLDYSYFKPEYFDRYDSFFNGDYNDTLIKVNIGLDKKPIEEATLVNEYSTTMIVNKYNKLNNDFVPPDLTELDNCSSGGAYLTKEAKLAYDELCKASIEAGLNLGTTSSYRSYKDQEDTYSYYLRVNGKEYAEKYVAAPGCSEHQTGLALDVKSVYSSPFKTTKEYKWMLENAYKYGFILRYPEGKENITLYNSEAWHFRYVGKDIAKYIKENNVTYEEYCAIFM